MEPVQFTELIRELTMDAITNDYEDFEMICKEVKAWAGESNIVVDESEVLKALIELVEEGLAKCYQLHPSHMPLEISPISVTKGHYFLLTPGGLRAIESRS